MSTNLFVLTLHLFSSALILLSAPVAANVRPNLNENLLGSYPRTTKRGTVSHSPHSPLRHSKFTSSRQSKPSLKHSLSDDPSPARSESETILRPSKRGDTTRTKSSDRKSMASICWNGAAYHAGGRAVTGDGDHFSTAGTPSQDHSVLITGEGCRRCTTGQLCRFVITLVGDGILNEIYPLPDIIAILNGPSVVAGEVRPLLDPQNSFLVTYKVWDEGIYQAGIKTGCADLAIFDIAILDSEAAMHPSRTVLSPCEEGTFGRWVRHFSGDGEYPDEEKSIPAFTPFECASPLADPRLVAQRLNRKKVFEVSLVGDEHMRNLFFHWQYLFVGKFVADLGADLSWVYAPSNSPAQLRVNFYWLDGIYEDGNFGCKFRGVVSGRTRKYPIFSKTSDVIFVNDGLWTFKNCTKWTAAYGYYLPKIIDWVANKVPRKKSSRVVWRSTPPFPLPTLGNCNDGPSNGAIAWANGIARDLSDLYGLEYMNFWHVEAPGYDDSCFAPNDGWGLGDWEKKATFSCLYHNFSKVYGNIGEAVLKTMLFYLGT